MAPTEPEVVTAVKEDFAQRGHKSLLKVLPDVDELRWHMQNVIPGSLPNALLVARQGAASYFAILIRNGNKPYEIRYVWKPSNNAKFRAQSSDTISEIELLHPFKHVNGKSKGEKRRLSIMIKWYFLTGGIINDNVGGELSDFCNRFHSGVELVKAATSSGEDDSEAEVEDETLIQPEDETLIEPEEDNEGPMLPQTFAEDFGSFSSIPETDASNDDDPTAGNASTGYNTLTRFLEDRGALIFLENIPRAEQMTWKLQSNFKDGLKKKLLVAQTKNKHGKVFALMRRIRHFHEVSFTLEKSGAEPEIVRTGNLVQFELLEPFVFCFTKKKLDDNDKARITLMVKFYHAAAGLADTALGETKAFPERLLNTLSFIATQSGGKRPVSRAGAPKQKSTNDVNVPRRPATATGHRHTVRATTPGLNNTSRSMKRSAADAGFDQLQALMNRDRELTRQMNALEEELHEIEIKRQAVEKLQRENRAAVRKKFDETYGA